MLPRIWNVEEKESRMDLGFGRFQFDFVREEDINKIMKIKPFTLTPYVIIGKIGVKG